MRYCLIYYKLLLCQLHHQFGFGGGDGKLEFILQVRLLQHIDDVVLHGGWLDAEFFCIQQQQLVPPLGVSEKSKISSISTSIAGFCVKEPWNPQRIPAVLP